MLTCIIIAHKRFEHYQIQNIDKSNCRIVFLVPKYAKHLCDISVIQSTDFVYFTDSINEESIKITIKQELSIQPNKANIRLLCNDEIFLLDVGAVRRKLGIKGATDADYLKFRDKVLMKTILREAGVRVPKFLQVERDQLLENPQLNYKKLQEYFNKNLFFVKPRQGASAIGAYKISSFQDFIKWINNPNIDNSYNCEQYLEGKLYLCDSFINKREVIFSAVCEYSYPCAEYDKGKPLGIIPLKNNEHINYKITNLTKEVCKALDAPDGAVHLEAFVLPDQSVVFLEIAARPGGAGVPKILERNYGFNTYVQTLRQSIGLPISSVIDGDHYAEIFWATMPGKIKKLNVPNIVSNNDIKWNINIGDVIEPQVSGTISPMAVRISMSNKNYQQLYEDFLSLSTFEPFILES